MKMRLRFWQCEDDAEQPDEPPLDMPCPYRCGVLSDDFKSPCERDKGHDGYHRDTSEGFVLTWKAGP